MGLQALFFYLFSAIMIAGALMVVFSRNPVHSVLFLILTFFNAAALFLLTGAEFLALIMVVVYVGAVAVLFLFVVMITHGFDLILVIVNNKDVPDGNLISELAFTTIHLNFDK